MQFHNEILPYVCHTQDNNLPKNVLALIETHKMVTRLRIDPKRVFSEHLAQWVVRVGLSTLIRTIKVLLENLDPVLIVH
jgi:hypothetical protein